MTNLLAAQATPRPWLPSVAVKNVACPNSSFNCGEVNTSYVAQQTGKNVEDVPYDVLTSAKLKEEFGQATFFTATDGNHGRGVAWAANKLGQKICSIHAKRLYRIPQKTNRK